MDGKLFYLSDFCGKVFFLKCQINEKRSCGRKELISFSHSVRVKHENKVHVRIILTFIFNRNMN